jgi:hypothetical protein
MSSPIAQLIQFISENNGINDKVKLSALVVAKFSLIKDRSVYYNDSFAIRFSQAMTSSFSNTVLALSNLQKFDSKPFFVCVVCPELNHMLTRIVTNKYKRQL